MSETENLRAEVECLKRQMGAARALAHRHEEWIDTFSSSLWKRVLWWLQGYRWKRVGRWYPAYLSRSWPDTGRA
jgi:hypothetical protein